MAEDVNVLDVVAVEQRRQGAAAHETANVANELPHTLGAELRRARHQSGGVVLADDPLAQVDELAVDLVAGQLLALHVEEALEQELVMAAEQGNRGTDVRHTSGLLTRGDSHEPPP